MQLKIKKVCLLSTIFVYIASFLLQSSFPFFGILAQDRNTRVNIVTILVDDKIYDWIASWLKWYASEYIQGKLSDTKALVLPLDLTNIHAYDIHRMMENIYFDWLENVNSSLIGLIMIWDIPLPVVNQDWYIFPTVYPYVDFENQKYIWDTDIEYFVPDDKPEWQAEIRHWLINYWTDTQAYLNFFNKIKRYESDPKKFIGDKIWYEDIISQKRWFLSENFSFYRNRVMFAEDLWYQRYSPLMKKMFRVEWTANANDMVAELESAVNMDFDWKELADEISSQWVDGMHTTKMVQQEIETSFISDYNDLFSNISSSTMRENIFSAWRWIKEYKNSDGEKSMIMNADNSSAKIQMKDDITLGNNSMQWLLENLNDLMESLIDKKIVEKHLSMDIVVPVSQYEVTHKKVWFRWYDFEEYYENYYFGQSARSIDKAEDLSIYRGTYRNLSDLKWVTYDSLSKGNNSTKSEYDSTDLKLRSIWWSYDIFSNQVEWNRWYNMYSVQDDYNIYMENRSQAESETEKKSWFGRVNRESWPESCSDDNCEWFDAFANRWWWWASAINLDNDSMKNGGIYKLSSYSASDSWRSIFDMWWFQSLKEWADEWMYWRWWRDWKWVWPQWAATSFKAYLKYASPTERKWWEPHDGGRRGRYLYYDNHMPNVHREFSSVDYFNWRLGRGYSLDGSSPNTTFILHYVDTSRDCPGRKCENTYTYKVINSVVKHTSTTEDQINWVYNDKYSEKGTLWWYYHDIKIGYENVKNTMDNILSRLTELKDEVGIGKEYIDSKIKDINAQVDGLSQWNTKLSELQEQLSGLNAKLADMDEDDDEYDDTKQSIKEIKNQIENLSSGNEWSENVIKSIMTEISGLIKQEHGKLEEIHSLVNWLYVENIIWTMEFIVYLEWWKVEDYYNETINSNNLNKIWFLSSWISDIKNIETYIKSKTYTVTSNYWDVYSDVTKQQEAWKKLAKKLKNESKNVSDGVDQLTEEMNQIFTFISDEKCEWTVEECQWSEENEELTSSTASEAMATLYQDFNRVDAFFSKLIVEDTVWKNIIIEAWNDTDFQKWLTQQSIVFKNMSDADKITEYAHWAAWDWSDSAWAKKNRSLLEGVSQHVPWMNILTADRPIDSPRYVVMQSVAWNEMKFIYPDLFKVEVYKSVGKNSDWRDIHELLTQKEIRDNLVKYLKTKVNEYNTIITNECKNAKSMDAYYNKIKSDFPLATPDKALHWCNEKSIFTYNEFVKALWWNEMLDVISELLYYQSLTNKRKYSDLNVEKDIELIKDSFNINDKREHVLQDYLVEWNEKIKSTTLVIPTYETLWYEVAYVNSDWKDYILTSDSDVNNDNSYSDASSSWSVDVDWSNLNPEWTSQEGELNDECNIPASWRLPLFDMDWSSPWLEWFKCWLKQTINEPMKVKLSFDSSLWDVVFSDWLGGFLESFWNAMIAETAETFVDYGDSWNSLLNKNKSNDADNALTQEQVKLQNHNRGVTQWDDALSNLLKKIDDNVKINNSNALLSDSNPTSELRIESAVDVWNITVEFTWTWDGCLKIDGKKLCNGTSLKKTFNSKTSPLYLEVSSYDHVAWKDWLIIKISVWGWYLEKLIKYTVSPSLLEKIDVKFWDEVAIAWMTCPVTVAGYDKYWNQVEWWWEKFEFTVSQWRFLKDWSYQENFTTNDFRNLNFYYQAPANAVDGSKATIQIKSLSSKIQWTWDIKIVQTNPVVKINWETVFKGKDEITVDKVHKLSTDEGVYEWWSINVNKLQRIEVDIMDAKWKLINYNWQISVSSKNGLFAIWKVSKQSNWKNIFTKTSKFGVSWGHALIYFYPTTSAWNDTISVNIPWLDTRLINYTVYPASSSNVKLNIENNYVELDWDATLEIFVSDMWWNATTENITLVTDSNYVELPGLKVSSRNGNMTSYSVTANNWYFKTTVHGKRGWLTSIEVREFATSIEFKVDKHIFPESGLNILYLNYFGNDWWNQWWYFSINNKHVETLMKKSNKIITTTTQLVSEDKIKKMIWKIDPWFQINDSDDVGTVMVMKWNDITLDIWWLYNMNSKLSSFKRVRVPNEETMKVVLNDKNSESENYVLFVLSNSDYDVSNGVLYNSGEYVGNITKWEVYLQLTDEKIFNGDNVWNIIVNGVNYGNLIFHFASFMPKAGDFNGVWNRYIVNKVFSRWSSDMMSSVWIFDWTSEFALDTNYKSIQDSDNLEEHVWFVWDFKNITLFGEWEIVWEATKKFWSELLINLWDPVLSRKWQHANVYWTDYDWWIWQEIYADSESDIFGVYQIDFDADGNKDWLVVYLDGRLKITKNYGRTPELRNMEELMRIAIRIKQVFVWDADGNGYDDILILTENNQIRAYLNHWWEFDVDGNIACLNQNVWEWEISATPSDLEWMNQFFVEDMNLDKFVDIIIYDAKWYIKVFYGWSTKWWANYLSTWSYACDDWWYSRQASNTVIVTALWLQLSNENIFDNSMLYRKWLTSKDVTITEKNMSEYWINIDVNDFDDQNVSKLIEPKDLDSDGSMEDALWWMMSADKFDVWAASQKIISETAKYVNVTLYDTTLLWTEEKNYIFVPSSFLDLKNPEDRGSVWKSYSWWSVLLQDGDIVKVKVTIKASDKYPTFAWAYWDVIQWPRKISYDGNGIIKWFKFLTNQRNAVVKKKDWNFAYIVDNITLKRWEVLEFEYELEYHHVPLKNMSISYETYWSNDKYPDIKLQSVDGCTKDFDGYINSWKKSFTQKTIGLQDMIDKEYQAEDENTKDYTEDLTKYGSDVTQLPWIVQNKIERSSLLNGLIALWAWWLENINALVDLSVFDEQTEAIENTIDTITQWMCNWFSFGWSNNCQWLPVPFNQAFLAPGKYHLFGCYNLPLGTLENWLTIFHFPGTITTPFGPLPFPWWMKWPWDGFIWMPWWTYPSFIRIYAAPTLTAQLWIAICVGPYVVWKALPSPFADLGGNCIVFAIKPQCKSGGDEARKKDSENPNDVYDDFIEDVRDSWVCLQSQKWPQVTEKWHRSSPFNLYSYSRDTASYGSDTDGGHSFFYDFVDYVWRAVIDPLNPDASFSVDDTLGAISWDNMDVNWWSNYGVELNKSFLWIIELETSSFIWADEEIGGWNSSSIFIGDVDILWWEFSVNKIRWWLQQWLRSMIIDKWLDPQIRYMVNQLTKMNVNIILPDISEAIDDAESIKDAMSNFWNIWNNQVEKNKLPSISTWSDISRENLNNLSRSLSNPFEALSSLMNESKIINISTEPIDVKVPFIFQEDISAYYIYLQQWLDVNGEIVEGWGNTVKSLSANCEKLSDKKEQEACYRNAQDSLNSFIEFRDTGWTKLQNQIYANLMILQEYRNFPFEIYEWVHVTDRYVSEIMSLINSTFWYLSYWTSTNSQRFVWYIDSIVLILNIIKTYQVLIDFSVDWSQNCGTCSKDTYDQYSCKLSMLCNMIDLPVIQIPNFKLPNITVDLSHIDLSLDIILPEFNFQPVNIDLPDLPNLPDVVFPWVWSISFDFDLPNIPLLPEPPELPELPSFIPEIEWQLPILPPAPELPKLPNEIESVIKVAEVIWKIYCVVKWKFGLVWEGSVKAKIEQLTQRTYEVKWMDNIMDFTNRSAAPLTNNWLDYEISSYVDFQYDFDYFYSYLDFLTKELNNLTLKTVDQATDWVDETLVEKPTDWTENKINQATDWTEGKVNQAADWVNEVVDDVANLIQGNTDETDNKTENNVGGNTDRSINNNDSNNGKNNNGRTINKTNSRVNKLDPQLNDKLSMNDTDLDVDWLLSDDIEYVNYEEAKQRLEDVLAYFVKETKDTVFWDSIKSSISKIENQINKENDVEPNIDDIEHSRDEILSYLNNKKVWYSELADLMNDNYDWFLAMVGTQSENSMYNSWQFLTFGVQLFDVNSSTKDVIKTITKENPYEMLLDNKKTVVDGYRNAVNTNTANDLWLTQSQYLVLRDHIWNIRNQVTTLYSVTKPVSSTQLIAKNSRIATNKSLLSDASSSRMWSNMQTADSVDPSSLSVGIYDKIVKWADAWKSAKVVYSDSFVSDIWNKYYSTTHSRWHNIVLWDEKSVYLKCVDQICSKWGVWYKLYYKSNTIKQIPYEEAWVSFNSSDETKLKIADKNQEVKNWRVAGQTYDALSFSWKVEDTDGYLIKLVERIDHSYEKVDYNSMKAHVHYVLALPETVNLDDLYAENIKLELLKKTSKIENLLDNELVEVVYYNDNKNLADIVITNIDRKWYYMRIAALNLDGDTYSIDSPWSNQIVAWRQVVWDNRWPKWKSSLYRPSVNEIVSEWDALQWYVSTKYRLEVNWEDNVGLSYIEISKNWTVLTGKYTSLAKDSISVDIGIHNSETTETYKAVWIDHFGNKTEKQISVSFSIPEITITDVSLNSDWKTIAITAEISQDLDQWNISFQRKRGSVWKTILPKDLDESDLLLKPKKLRVTWSPYSVGNDIAMYDKNWEVIALMDPNTAEIKLQTWYIDNFEINVSVEDTAVLSIYNKLTQSSVFSVTIPYEECNKIEADGYKVKNLPEKWQMWIFNGWKAIYNNEWNVLFVSPTCHLYSEIWLRWTYDYDIWQKSVVLTLYQWSDYSKENPIKIWAKAKPFLEN